MEERVLCASWFTFDGVPWTRPAAPVRIGADAPTMLAELGYSAADVQGLTSRGVIGPTEWFQQGRPN